MKCKNCQSELGHLDHICKICGTPVPVNPALEDLYFSRLAANAPAAFVQKMRSASYISKERRNVTALMFSVANIDDFTETIPEEERTFVLNKALDRFSKMTLLKKRLDKYCPNYRFAKNRSSTYNYSQNSSKDRRIKEAENVQRE